MFTWNLICKFLNDSSLLEEKDALKIVEFYCLIII